MARTKRKTAQEKLYERLIAGEIYIDMLRICIPVFLTEKDCNEFLVAEGITPCELDTKVHGFAGFANDPEGRTLFYVTLPIDTQPRTWVHEASHLVDFIMHKLGMETDLTGTETRAYMIDHIFSSIEDIMSQFAQVPAIVALEPINERPV